MLRSAYTGHVGDALRKHANEWTSGGVPLAVNREFVFGKVAPAGLDHAFFEGGRPCGHAEPEIRLRLSTCQCARAVAIAFAGIFDHIVLVDCDQLALLPN